MNGADVYFNEINTGKRKAYSDSCKAMDAEICKFLQHLRDKTPVPYVYKKAVNIFETNCESLRIR